jgi:HlyD family secretion protein
MADENEARGIHNERPADGEPSEPSLAASRPAATPRRPAAARRPRARRWLAAGIGVAGLVGAAYLLRSLWSPAVDPSTLAGELTYKVPRGDLLISFTERGNIRAARSVPIYSSVEGSSTIVTLVPEGTYVSEGEILVELDSSEMTQLHNQQQIAVDTAEADLLQATEALEIQKSLSESEVRDAELALKLAEIDMKKYEEGDYKLALTKANADKTIAEEELTRAKNKYEWTQKLAEKGYVTGTELIADRLAVSKADLQLEQARGELEVLEKYTHKKDHEKYSSDLRQAQHALDRSKRKAKSEVAQAEAAKKGKDSTLRLSEKRLQKISDQLAKTKIRAPKDGMVVYSTEGWRRDRVIEQGAEVRENQLLMNLPDVSTMAVEAQVHESRVDQVREGLTAFVSIDALPNLNLKGKVTKVGLLPDSVNRWMNPDLKVYQTEVTIEESPDVKLLKPGMSAKVQIIVTVLKDVVYVPVQSVTSVDRDQVCYVYVDGRFQPRAVKTGRYNESFVEIASGLAEGDVIQLNAPAPKGSAAEEEAERAAAIAAAEAQGEPPPMQGGRGMAPGEESGGRRSKGSRDRGGRKDARGGEGGPGDMPGAAGGPGEGFSRKRRERRENDGPPMAAPAAVVESRTAEAGQVQPAAATGAPGPPKAAPIPSHSSAPIPSHSSAPTPSHSSAPIPSPTTSGGE